MTGTTFYCDAGQRHRELAAWLRVVIVNGPRQSDGDVGLVAFFGADDDAEPEAGMYRPR